MADETSARPPTARPRRARRRILRALALLAALAVALVLVGPTLAAPFVRSRIVAALNARLDARATLEELSFDLGGRLRAEDFELAARDGARIAALGTLDARVDVLGAARGRYALELELVGPELHVRRAADGRWNLEGLRRPEAEAPPAPGAPEPAGEPTPAPELRATVRVRDGRLVVHGVDGTTELADVTLELRLDALDRPAPVELSARVVGPGGDAGRLVLRGDVTLAAGGRLGADALEAALEASLDALALDGLAPALALAGPALPRVVGGGLDARATLSVARGPALEATFALGVEGLTVAGEGAGQPRALGGLTLDARLSSDARGTGAHTLELTLPGRATLRATGASEALLEDGGTLRGALTVEGDVGGLAALARGFVPLRADLTPAGALAARASWSAARVGTGLGAAGVELTLALSDLARVDAAGAARPLTGLEDATLSFALDADPAAGRVALRDLALSAGPLQAAGHAALTGLSAGGTLGLDASRLELTADLDRASAIARELLDLGALELGGALEAALEARAADGADGAYAIVGRLTAGGLRVSGLTGAGGAPAALGPFGLEGELSARLDPLPGAGRARLEALALRGPGVELAASGTFEGLSGADSPPRGTLRLEPRLLPAELSAFLAPFLSGAALDGAPLAGAFDLELAGDALALRGALAGDRLRLTLPPEPGARTPRALVQRSPRVELELAHDAARDGGRLELTRLRYAATGASATVTGTVTDTAGEAPRAALELTASAELAELLPDLRALLPDPAPTARGALTGRLRADGDARALALVGQVSAQPLLLELPVEGAPRPARVDEPELTLELVATADATARALDLERLALACPTARGALAGRFEAAAEAGGGLAFRGLSGELRYVPDRLGAWLAPWLPGTLEGAGEETATLSFDGALGAGGTLALLRALRGEARVGLGRFTAFGLRAGGTLALDARGDALTFGGALQANGGTLGLDGRIDLRQSAAAGAAPVASTLTLKSTGVTLAPELAPLLEYLHPAFAALGRAEVGAVRGTVSSEVTLRYDAPLTDELLARGWAALPKAAVGGNGRVELAGVSLAGSPLLASLGGLLGQDPGRELAFDPLRFGIREGRVGYDKPWQWTISGAPTQFAGTIGLDRTLALSWKVPVTPALVAKHSFLRTFQGETLEVPIGGTIDRPQLSVQAVLDDLARSALERELRGRLGGGELPGLDDLLGGGDPDALLKQADALWTQGDRAGAAKLYRELREKHQASLTYLLNKSRIKARSEGQ